MSKEDFIKNSKLVWGDTYDYSQVEYINNKKKVKIICKKHGEFLVYPNRHTYHNQGCPYCKKIEKANKICGVAINDMYLGHKNEFYSIWTSMIHRCYDKKERTYFNCKVCDEWLVFSNFKKWAESKESGYKKGYCLDKDILVKGNKTYSPTTCAFVPPYINTLIIKSDFIRGECCIGVKKTSSSKFFEACIKKNNKNIYLGMFHNEYDAFLKYKSEKESYIKEIANKYKNEIHPKVYDALIKYKVEYDD